MCNKEKKKLTRPEKLTRDIKAIEHEETTCRANIPFIDENDSVMQK